ncbi:GNAT family N-acetyltransferase [Rhizobium paknamense]|uniref:Ribosomal-protein-alanine N-acetyltransferase n=1 Tax=Rhizobium paknamense TaxID=1206817 RepID=A0ABU0I6Y6_9HYPH|nr:GNAT family N-acetyltransferase [Rhizobium paknamense]MDQ0453975.1 ribosomal-protein-alanine N-acetyltransferase [Rhizobium paknamense]
MAAIRGAHPDELGILAEIGFRAWERAMIPVGESRAMVENARIAFKNFTRSSPITITVVENHGRPMGWAAREMLDERISDFWIDPDHLRKGYGSVLLSAVEDAIRHAGYEETRLETHARNREAVQFFKSHGFGIQWLSVVYNPKLDRDMETVGMAKRLVQDERLTYGPGAIY